ncbi:hypothetical protein GCM10010433_49790 [Streptomyces pulveraceus]
MREGRPGGVPRLPHKESGQSLVWPTGDRGLCCRPNPQEFSAVLFSATGQESVEQAHLPGEVGVAASRMAGPEGGGLPYR